jgi:alpha-tubulin suppressor-like RCC1 family protein
LSVLMMVGGLLLFASSASAYGPENLDAGLQHTCFVTSAGTVKCWGDNEHGQLGDGTTTERHSPVEVTGLPEAFEIATGAAHTCARSDGKVWCWGDNGHGQLGDGTTTDRHSPVEVTGVSGLVGEVTAGNEHTCSDIQNKVWCWGDNGHGQLGDGTTTDRHSPVEVTELPGGGALAAGGSYTCVVSYFSWCWGDNEHGQLDDGSTVDHHTPVEVASDPPSGPIAAGGSHACTLKATGKVWCWGDNEHGQLGNGSTSVSSVPVGVKTLAGPIAVATGGSTSCSVTGAGKVKCWGEQNGTGIDSSSPTVITGLAGVTGIGVGGNHSCALATPMGKVWCWGSNEDGQLGDGSTTERDQPVEALGLSTAVAVAVGDLHTCVVLEAATVKCWGDNEHGQLGDGTTTERHSPVEVTGLSGVTQVAAGASFTCALTGDGKVWCWGDNGHGQLGDGTTTDRHSPVEVTGLPPAAEIAAGGDHACAITEAGKVWCWGDNEHGQLGDGTTTERHSPVEVTGLAEATQITSGADYTCVMLTAAGEPFWCWGDNQHGQLGDGTTTERHAPAEIHFLAASSVLAAGGAHTCALLHSGLVECWGDNEHGQLGDGTTTERHSPVEAPVEQEGQRIGLQTFRNQILGDPDLRPDATSSSNLFVTVASLTPDVCTILAGEIHLVGLGECKVRAEQAGNVRYAAAVPVVRRFQVGLTPGTGAISGRVTAEGGAHSPLAQILACALQDEGEKEVLGQNCALTDAEGKYLIPNLPNGAYKIEFWPRYSGSGYVFEYYENALSWSDAKPVEVAEDLAEGVDAELTDGGEISGKVTAASDGEPLGNVLVCAEDINEEFEECASTGADGTYRIQGLVAGEYAVSFLVPEGEGFRSQTYDGKSDPSEADLVQVATGGVVGDVNAALGPEATITGRVSDASTHGGLGEIEVCAFELTGLDFEVCELSGTSGTYTLTDLPAGKYKVGFFPESLLEEDGESSPVVPQYWNDKPSWESADVLTLGLGATAGGIDASLVSSSTPPTHQTEQPPETQRSPRTVTPDPIVTIPPRSVAPKHCPAGRKRKKIDGKTRCVKSQRGAHHKHRHRNIHGRAFDRIRRPSTSGLSRSIVGRDAISALASPFVNGWRGLASMRPRFEPASELRALLAGSARLPAYQLISPRIVMAAQLTTDCQRCCKSAPLPWRDLQGRVYCHAEGRGFESLQPLFRECPARGRVGSGTGRQNQFEPSAHIARHSRH